MTATDVSQGGGVYDESGEPRQRYPRRFYLHRKVDKTGISGTGVVADGVVWQTGAATLNWRGGGESYNTWPGPDAISEIERIHGHQGATVIVWRDDTNGYPFHEQTQCPYDVSSKVKDLDLEVLD